MNRPCRSPACDTRSSLPKCDVDNVVRTFPDTTLLEVWGWGFDRVRCVQVQFKDVGMIGRNQIAASPFNGGAEPFSGMLHLPCFSLKCSLGFKRSNNLHCQCIACSYNHSKILDLRLPMVIQSAHYMGVLDCFLTWKGDTLTNQGEMRCDQPKCRNGDFGCLTASRLMLPQSSTFHRRRVGAIRFTVATCYRGLTQR